MRRQYDCDDYVPPVDVAFSENELGTYRALQDRYRQDRDFLDEVERLRLRFIRWLVETGAVAP